MAYSLRTDKTWAQTDGELQTEFSRWGVRDYEVRSLGRGSRANYQTLEDRRVAIRWTTREGREMRLEMADQESVREVAILSPRLRQRPVVGSLIVPFMVDERIQPIDFKAVDPRHVDACAQQKLCGVCGQRIRPGKDRFCFLGPARELECFGDPWMHDDCAEYTAGHCPFVSGKRRVWREGDQPLTDVFKGSWMLLTARGGRTHLELRHWHFQPVDVVRREVFERHTA